MSSPSGRRMWLWAGLLLVAAVVVGTRSGRSGAAAPTLPARRSPLSVRIETAVMGTEPDVVEVAGVLRARIQTELTARHTAVVQAVTVAEGDAVRPGQTLVTLEDRDPAARLDAARAASRAAEQALTESDRARAAAGRAIVAAEARVRLTAAARRRAVGLAQRGGASAQAADEAVAADDAAQAERDAARDLEAAARARRAQVADRLAQARAGEESAVAGRDDTRLAAPFAGRVRSRPVDPGTLAGPGVSLMRLESEEVRLEVDVPVSLMERIGPESPVKVHLDAGGPAVGGRVHEVSPSADPASRTVRVRVALPPDAWTRPGTWGTARFTVGKRTALRIPRAAVHRIGVVESVFVADPEATARLRLVRVGDESEDPVEILAGLSVGERVVVGMSPGLTEGRRIVGSQP